MNVADNRPGSPPIPHERSMASFRCGECGRPLLWRSVPVALLSPTTAACWETPPQAPPGAPEQAAAESWICSGEECRRVYQVWQGIPNFLQREAGVLTAAAYAQVLAAGTAG